MFLTPSESVRPCLMALSLSCAGVRAMTQREVDRPPVMEKRGALGHQKEAGANACLRLSWRMHCSSPTRGGWNGQPDSWTGRTLRSQHRQARALFTPRRVFGTHLGAQHVDRQTAGARTQRLQGAGRVRAERGFRGPTHHAGGKLRGSQGHRKGRVELILQVAIKRLQLVGRGPRNARAGGQTLQGRLDETPRVLPDPSCL